MTTTLRIGGWCALLVLAIPLSACGGGGGGGGGSGASSASITFSASSLSFKAAAPFAPPPPDQTVTATLNGSASGTLYITIDENNPNVATATNITASGNSGQATIVPASPATLLAGTHQGSFTVHACLNDPTCASGELSGSPQTISVTYEIGSSVDTNTIMPRVVAAGTGGNVILRGSGFTDASAVTFGTTPAVSMSVVSDTEIHASYPPLAAGSYPISVDSGDIAYSATLNVVSPPAYTATFLPYPLTTPVTVSSMTYDADRSALLVVTGSTLLRYAFDGTSWGTPTQVTISGLQQVSVSPDGAKLLALVATTNATTNSMTMLELDPVTLSQTASAPVTESSHGGFTGNISGGFAYANDGNAIVWSDVMSSVYVYGTSSQTWTVLYDTQNEQIGPGATLASGDGSVVMIAPYDEYVASAGAAQPLATLGNVGDSLASADLTGSEFAAAGGVVDQQGQLLGQVPGDANGMVINPAGTRLYAVQATDPQPELHTYDLTATPSGGAYPELGTAITLADNGTTNMGVPFRLAITPDGSVVFVAGSSGIAVQPVP